MIKAITTITYSDDAAQTPIIDESKQFFVSCMNEAGAHRRLLGPYALHADALANVQRGDDLACKADARAHWYSFGTVSMPKDIQPVPTTIFGT